MALSVQAKLGGRTADVLVEPPATLSRLVDAVAAALGVGDGNMKLLHKGKHLNKAASDPGALLADLGVAAGAKLMVMLTKAAEKAAVESAQPARMRGFDDDDRRQRGDGLPAGASSSRGQGSRGRSSQPAYRFHGIRTLSPLPPGVGVGEHAAEELLRQLSTDRAILAIMAKHRWNVGMLSEMAPEGKVGVSESCLMGLNKNAGQEILLRLRTDDWQGLRPYHTVIDVLLHELTHNVHGDHDDHFKALNSQLKREYKEHSSAHQGRALDAGARFAPASSSSAAPVDMEVDRGHVLGGGGAAGGGVEDARQAAAMAAAARAATGGAGTSRAEGTAAGPAAAAGAGGGVLDWTESVACACGLCGAGEQQCGECEA